MNLKEAIFRHLCSIPGFNSENIFQDARRNELADLENIETRDFQVIFFESGNPFYDNYTNKISTRFEFHFLAHESKEDTLEIARDLFRESISAFYGILGGAGGLKVFSAEYGQERQGDDWETEEKNLMCQVVFSYVKQSAKSI
jgi:hypothetical protein